MNKCVWFPFDRLNQWWWKSKFQVRVCANAENDLNRTFFEFCVAKRFKQFNHARILFSFRSIYMRIRSNMRIHEYTRLKWEWIYAHEYIPVLWPQVLHWCPLENHRDHFRTVVHHTSGQFDVVVSILGLHHHTCTYRQLEKENKTNSFHLTESNGNESGITFKFRI